MTSKRRRLFERSVSLFRILFLSIVAKRRCMRMVLALVTLGVHLATWSSAQTIRDLVGADFSVRIIAVADGDTVEAIPDGEKRAIRLRLEGVDTPERGEAFYDEARRFTRVLLFDRNARATGRDIDRYGRLVARLRVESKDASVELVRAGLGCHYTDYSSDPALAKAEIEARTAGRGFWARSAPKPRCALERRSPEPDAGRSESRSTGAQKAFHGNTSSRVYHAPSCRNYNCRNCTHASSRPKPLRKPPGFARPRTASASGSLIPTGYRLPPAS